MYIIIQEAEVNESEIELCRAKFHETLIKKFNQIN